MNKETKTARLDPLFCRGASWLAGFLLLFLACPVANVGAVDKAFPFLENGLGFAQHTARVQQFEAQRARFLKERLRQTRQTGQNFSQQKQKQRDKAFLRHRDKLLRFEQNRKAAFADYKKQRQKYRNQQAAVLKIRQACSSPRKETSCTLSPAF